jgi:predicted porin
MTGGVSTSRQGFRGEESLEAGLKAGFWLEGDVLTDTGGPANGLDFMRRSTVSLTGNSGELRLGRDFVPNYLNMIAFDAYDQRGLGIIEYYGYGTSMAQGGGFNSGGAAFNYLRNSNNIAYFLPANLVGLYGTVQYAFGERSAEAAASGTDSWNQGNALGARIGHASGPQDISVADTRFSDVSRAAMHVDDYNVANAAASWNFGVVKASVFWQQEKMNGRVTLPDFRSNTYAVGATAPVGPGVVRASLSYYDNQTTSARDVRATKVALGYIHHLSKRTALYAEVARVGNQQGAAFQVAGYGSSISGVKAPAPGAAPLDRPSVSVTLFDLPTYF